MKRNALTRAVKIFDFGTPLVGNRVERICNFVFAFEFRQNLGFGLEFNFLLTQNTHPQTPSAREGALPLANATSQGKGAFKTHEVRIAMKKYEFVS